MDLGSWFEVRGQLPTASRGSFPPGLVLLLCHPSKYFSDDLITLIARLKSY